MANTLLQTRCHSSCGAGQASESCVLPHQLITPYAIDNPPLGQHSLQEITLRDAADVPEHKLLARITVSPFDAKIVTETTYPPPSKFLLLTLRMYGKHAAHLDVP
ncbi:hypothetical protein AcV7_002765 [Taiwanofungus camphoratus]|nr:hypothetical protein AcV7_002765 [Antrodia cinnamomea]